MHSKKIGTIKNITFILSNIMFALALSGCGNSADADKVKQALEVNQLDITSLELKVDKPIMESLETQQITAEAIIGDGSGDPLDVSDKVKWTSSNSDLASINSSGLLTGKSEGLITITASLADLVATTDIQLSSALLETINILNSPSPVSVCKSGYVLEASGNYDDATVRNITADVTWTSDDATRLSINESGMFSTYKDGTSVVTATKNSISGNTSITINDDISTVAISSIANSVYINKTLVFTATGTYDDTSTADVTNTVTWSSDSTDILTISNDTATKGKATGVAEGSANISASCLTTVATISNTLATTVSEEPIINAIAIEEDLNILEFKIVDSPEQLTANLKRSDGSYSTDVSDSEFTTWTINETISGEPVKISSSGEITFTAVGTTKIKVRHFDKDNNVGPFDDFIEVEIVAN